MRRVSASEIRSFAEIYPRLNPGELLNAANDQRYAVQWGLADAGSFAPREMVRPAA
jgi:hypothetical protein